MSTDKTLTLTADQVAQRKAIEVIRAKNAATTTDQYRSERDQQALEATLATIKSEVGAPDYVKRLFIDGPQVTKEVAMPAGFHGAMVAAQHDTDSASNEATQRLVRQEMAPSRDLEAFRKREQEMHEVSVEQIKAEMAANRTVVNYGGPELPFEAKPHPRQAELDAIRQRHGLPLGELQQADVDAWMKSRSTAHGFKP